MNKRKRVQFIQVLRIHRAFAQNNGTLSAVFDAHNRESYAWPNHAETNKEVIMEVIDHKFHIKGWAIDPRLNRMTGQGKTVLIEPKVMQVLTCLAAHPGEVVSRDDLLNQVWDGTIVTDHVLTRSISELRKVFEDDARARQHRRRRAECDQPTEPSPCTHGAETIRRPRPPGPATATARRPPC